MTVLNIDFSYSYRTRTWRNTEVICEKLLLFLFQLKSGIMCTDKLYWFYSFVLSFSFVSSVHPFSHIVFGLWTLHHHYTLHNNSINFGFALSLEVVPLTLHSSDWFTSKSPNDRSSYHPMIGHLFQRKTYKDKIAKLPNFAAESKKSQPHIVI